MAFRYLSTADLWFVLSMQVLPIAQRIGGFYLFYGVGDISHAKLQ